MRNKPLPNCPCCGGTGGADSGGVEQWGAPVLVPCECTEPFEWPDGIVLKGYNVAPDPKCSACGGTGAVDSGGVEPWGEPVRWVPCVCLIDRAGTGKRGSA